MDDPSGRWLYREPDSIILLSRLARLNTYSGLLLARLGNLQRTQHPKSAASVHHNRAVMLQVALPGSYFNSFEFTVLATANSSISSAQDRSKSKGMRKGL